MRPNLMSPRRTSATGSTGSSGEDSILAMLEREPARRRNSPMGASGARLAWYGASAAVALALTGALVWLAANNDGLRHDVHDTVLADAGKAAQRSAPALVPTVAPAAAAPALRPTALAVQGAAVIVDQAPAPEGVPPLRLLKPAPTTAAAAPAPARPAARPSPPRPAAPATVEARPLARPALSPLPAPAKAKPVLAAKSPPRPAAARTARPATPARAPDAPVDADVALISAVIVHANGHAPPGSQMTELLCPNDNCKARPGKD